MRKVVVFTNLSLDGVMQAPGRQDEDLRDDFPFGGWGAPYAAMQSPEIGNSLGDTGPLLFGRRTYQDFYGFWPKQMDSPFREILNNNQKYVASRTLKEPLPWQNSILLSGEATDTVAALKAQPGKDFLVMGSGELVQSLMQHDLVDRFVLLIYPLILGRGRRLFPEGSPHSGLQLLNAKPTANGVIVATYQPAPAG